MSTDYYYFSRLGLATSPSKVLIGCLEYSDSSTAGIGIVEIPLNAAYDTPGTIATYGYTVNSDVARC